MPNILFYVYMYVVTRWGAVREDIPNQAVVVAHTELKCMAVRRAVFNGGQKVQSHILLLINVVGYLCVCKKAVVTGGMAMVQIRSKIFFRCIRRIKSMEQFVHKFNASPNPLIC